MESTTFTYKSHDEKDIFVYKWSPAGTPKATMLVIHGLAEHAMRYEKFAEKATEAGYLLYALDWRGHGKTAGSASELGVIDNDGWNFVVNDLHLLGKKIQTEHPNLPFFIFGHSIGAELTQDYIIRWGSEPKAVMLSGPQSQQPGYLLLLGEMLGKSEIKKLGPRTPSKTFQKMSYDKFNRAFRPNITTSDWITSDVAEAKIVADDNLCGWAPSTQLSVELMRGFKRIHKKSNRQLIPKSLPIRIIYGGADVSCGGKTLIKKYYALGLKVDSKSYPGKRHELLHETNRKEVMQEIIDWFDSQL